MDIEIKCPTCPMCGQPPTMAISYEQAFCGDGSCPAFSWNMTITMAENRRTMNVIDLRGTGLDGQP